MTLTNYSYKIVFLIGITFLNDKIIRKSGNRTLYKSEASCLIWASCFLLCFWVEKFANLPDTTPRAHSKITIQVYFYSTHFMATSHGIDLKHTKSQNLGLRGVGLVWAHVLVNGFWLKCFLGSHM